MQDVLIVGSGFAGLSAAYEAANAGASVLVLEKANHFGGNSTLVGGVCSTWDSGLKMREKLGLGEDSAQLFAEDIMKGGKNHNIPELVDVMAKNAPAGLDFLTGAGITFADVLLKPGGLGTGIGDAVRQPEKYR